MIQQQLDRYSELMGAKDLEGALMLLVPIYNANPKDTLATVLIADLQCDLKNNYQGAFDLYTQAMNTLLNEGDEDVNDNYLIDHASQGRARCFTYDGQHENAYKALDLCLMVESDSGFEVINESFISRFLSAGREAGGIRQAEEGARKMLQMLKVDTVRQLGEREKLAAIIYAYLAEQFVVKYDEDRYGLIDDSISGIDRCRRICSIFTSYIDIVHGSSPLGDFGRVYMKVEMAWRVLNNRSLAKVDSRPSKITDEIRTCGMFDLMP